MHHQSILNIIKKCRRDTDIRPNSGILNSEHKTPSTPELNHENNRNKLTSLSVDEKVELSDVRDCSK